MAKNGKKHKLYGLLGRNISYSFSKGYFTKKFEALNLTNCEYVNFDVPSVENITQILKNNPHLKGFNVTIPYKEEILPLLTDFNKKAKLIGAVNTVKVTKKGLKGYNTDFYGFKKSILPYLKPHHKKALILGTGGASKAIAYALDELGIGYKYVSRNSTLDILGYDILTKNIMEDFQILINCTPLGTHPKVEEKPPIPYQFINKRHLLYDLVYNPSETTFMKLGKERGATVCNGLSMLELQAEKAWKIWNS